MELVGVTASQPSLLILNVTENLQPKVDYLVEAFGGNQDVLRAVVLQIPALLAYSLENRIRPRLEAIIKAGLAPSEIKNGIVFKDDDFEIWLKNKRLKR